MNWWHQYHKTTFQPFSSHTKTRDILEDLSDLPFLKFRPTSRDGLSSRQTGFEFALFDGHIVSDKLSGRRYEETGAADLVSLRCENPARITFGSAGTNSSVRDYRYCWPPRNFRDFGYQLSFPDSAATWRQPQCGRFGKPGQNRTRVWRLN